MLQEGWTLQISGRRVNNVELRGEALVQGRIVGDVVPQEKDSSPIGGRRGGSHGDGHGENEAGGYNVEQQSEDYRGEVEMDWSAVISGLPAGRLGVKRQLRKPTVLRRKGHDLGRQKNRIDGEEPGLKRDQTRQLEGKCPEGH